MSEKQKTWKPEVRPARVVKPGARPLPDLSEIPELDGGPLVHVAVRIDQRTADCIQEHYDRLTQLAGTVVTLSDTLRSLIHKGAEAYRIEFANRPKQDT